ncbi:THAP domain-containing protein 7-like [Tachysurus ichikawai]
MPLFCKQRYGQENEKDRKVQKDLSVRIVAQIREMVVDYRKRRTTTCVIIIMGRDVELADTCIYIGVHLDNSLHWQVNSVSVQERKKEDYYMRDLFAARCLEEVTPAVITLYNSSSLC